MVAAAAGRVGIQTGTRRGRWGEVAAGQKGLWAGVLRACMCMRHVHCLFSCITFVASKGLRDPCTLNTCSCDLRESNAWLAHSRRSGNRSACYERRSRVWAYPPPTPSASAVAEAPGQSVLPRFFPAAACCSCNADTCVQPVAGQLRQGPSLSTLFLRQAAACGSNSSRQLRLHQAQAAACSADAHLCQCLSGAGNVASAPKHKQRHHRFALQHLEHGDSR